MHAQLWVAVILLQTAMQLVDGTPTEAEMDAARALIRRAITFLEGSLK